MANKEENKTEVLKRRRKFAETLEIMTVIIDNRYVDGKRIEMCSSFPMRKK
ncbi:MAG: hypothetical protein AAB616_02135 [Patescibacteria group bacterium]